MALAVKNPPANAGDCETWVQSWVGEITLEEGMATHSSTLDRRSPWTEKPGGGSQRVRHWSDFHTLKESLEVSDKENGVIRHDPRGDTREQMWVDGLRGVWGLTFTSFVYFILTLSLSWACQISDNPKSKKLCMLAPNHPPSWGLQVPVVSQPCTLRRAHHKPSKVTAPITDTLRLFSVFVFSIS